MQFLLPATVHPAAAAHMHSCAEVCQWVEREVEREIEKVSRIGGCRELDSRRESCLHVEIGERYYCLDRKPLWDVCSGKNRVVIILMSE